MTISVDPTHIIASAPTQARVDAIVDHEARTGEIAGHQTLVQKVDQLDISAGAKHAIEDTMVAQQYNLYSSGAAGSLTSAQKQSIFNGSVASAVQNYASGQGSVFDIGAALYGRGQRINEAIAGTATPPVATPPIVTPPVATTPIVTPDTPTSTGA